MSCAPKKASNQQTMSFPLRSQAAVTHRHGLKSKELQRSLLCSALLCPRCTSLEKFHFSSEAMPAGAMPLLRSLDGILIRSTSRQPLVMSTGFAPVCSSLRGHQKVCPNRCNKNPNPTCVEQPQNAICSSLASWCSSELEQKKKKTVFIIQLLQPLI